MPPHQGRAPPPPKRGSVGRLWGVGTAAICLSRPEGPVLAVPLLACVLLLLGLTGVRAAWAASPRAAALASAAGGASLAAGVTWALLVLPRLPTVGDTEGSFSTGESTTPVLTAAAHELRRLPSEVVSASGWRDVPFPRWLAGAWLLLTTVVTLVAVARVLGVRRRTALILLAAVGPTVYTVGAVAVLNPVGASAQGRYVLRLLAAAVVLAASSVPARRSGEARVPTEATLGGRWRLGRPVTVLGLVGAAVAFVGHTTARYLDARRYAVGPDAGGVGWLLDAPWQPAGGTWPWLLAGVVGAGLVAAAPLMRLGTRPPERRVPA